MIRVGLIVDGAGDFAALKTRFGEGFKILKTDGPRGHSVSITQIVAGSRKQIAILRAFGCESVVIVTDFEDRPSGYHEFCAALELSLQAVRETNVKCAVPNRMIENWYLADIAYLATQKVFLKDDVKQRPFEGTHGKDELKKLFAKGHSYNEVTHGAQLFALLRFDEARRRSASFDRFLSLTLLS